MTFTRYNLHPKNFDEILNASREQSVYAAELGHSPPFSECVVFTAEAMFDLFAIIAQLRREVGELKAAAP